MVATQNIDTVGQIWTFSLRGVLTFVVILRGQQMYTVIQGVHSLLCVKVAFIQCCPMKRYINNNKFLLFYM